MNKGPNQLTQLLWEAYGGTLAPKPGWPLASEFEMDLFSNQDLVLITHGRFTAQPSSNI